MTIIRGPIPCINCQRPVVWDRRGGALRLMNRRPAGKRHVCAEVCGAWMPLAKERCARAPGHLGSHRSRYVMDSEARMRRGKWAAA